MDEGEPDRAPEPGSVLSAELWANRVVWDKVRDAEPLGLRSVERTIQVEIPYYGLCGSVIYRHLMGRLAFGVSRIRCEENGMGCIKCG